MIGNKPSKAKKVKAVSEVTQKDFKALDKKVNEIEKRLDYIEARLLSSDIIRKR